MRDELQKRIISSAGECGIINLEKSDEDGSHWCAWLKHGSQRYYFDSFGQRPPDNMVCYLKTKPEYKFKKCVIQYNVTTVQKDLAEECGGLCLYWLYKMTNVSNTTFDFVLIELKQRYKKSRQSPLIIHLI